jgi:hypothetical protein
MPRARISAAAWAAISVEEPSIAATWLDTGNVAIGYFNHRGPREHREGSKEKSKVLIISVFSL